ncbi:MAG TPA: VWA domain-containing protein [Thermoanaerobaculia bacterium]|nr:VWA domain-containing protein [Thermoanaerobaculia bacterium]
MRTLALLAALLSSAAPAAEPPAAPPRAAASVEVSLFNLDVVVTDPSGARVRGLKAEDFEVRHDGKVVPVSNFSEIRAGATTPGREPEPGAAAPSTAPRPPRRIVLFLDRLYIPDAVRRAELFDALSRLLEVSIEEGDEAMVVTWNRSIRTVLPFTGDVELLAATLRGIERQSGRIAPEKADQDLLRESDQWFTSLAADPRIGTDFGGFMPSAELAAQQAFFEMKAKTAALKGLAATLGGMDGRKVLVFVSHRFSRYAGLEFLLKDRTGAEALGDPRTRQFDSKRLLEEVARAANANGVTLNGVFPAELDSAMPTADRPISTAPGISDQALGGKERIVLDNELEALSFVAEKTGGVAAVGAGNVDRFVDRVASDLESWYSIGYPAPPGAGRSVPVSVKVKGRKLDVRVRSSLVEKSTAEQMADRVLAHLFQPDGRARIPISATASPVPSQDGKYRIRVEVQIPIASLALLPTAKGAQGAFSVLVASVAAAGDFSEVSRRSQAFEIPAAELETAKAGHYTYELEIVAAGPDARICVGVWDEKGSDAGFAVVTSASPAAPPAAPPAG